MKPGGVADDAGDQDFEADTDEEDVSETIRQWLCICIIQHSLLQRL